MATANITTIGKLLRRQGYRLVPERGTWLRGHFVDKPPSGSSRYVHPETLIVLDVSPHTVRRWHALNGTPGRATMTAAFEFEHSLSRERKP
ncbi:MAG: hypothetical protein KDD44_04775 [Bdellovibrionales bacterium]|nr:hypothetical protein [Bdellovibrionales bacterium]